MGMEHFLHFGPNFMWPTERHLISTGYVCYAGLCLAGECRRLVFPAVACRKEVHVPGQLTLNYCLEKHTKKGICCSSIFFFGLNFLNLFKFFKLVWNFQASLKMLNIPLILIFLYFYLQNTLCKINLWYLSHILPSRHSPATFAVYTLEVVCSCHYINQVTLRWSQAFCSSRKYSYLPQRRDFFLRTPPPPQWKFQLSIFL